MLAQNIMRPDKITEGTALKLNHVPHALHVKLTSMDLRGKFKSMDALFP
jgi:hypothetical protein